MIFAVSYAGLDTAKGRKAKPADCARCTGLEEEYDNVDHDAERQRVSKLIQSHGGALLEIGFNELFDFDITEDSLEDAAFPHTHGHLPSLQVKPQWEKAGFACVITNRHSRRPKYLQALALGIPCLAGRWVDDCVQQQRVLDWEPYLLPSGKSDFLRGAIRSRTIQYHAPETARLQDTIRHGPNLLRGKSVLFVVGNAKTNERRKSHLFLTYALGASNVRLVRDITAANSFLAQARADDNMKWDLLYRESQEKDVHKGKGGKGQERGKKRPRSSAVSFPNLFRRSMSTTNSEKVEDEDDDRSSIDTTKGLKTITDEYLIQSIILGRLLPSEPA